MDNFITQLLGDNILSYIIVTVPVLIFVVLYALLAVWAERKVSAWIQDRRGPNRRGYAGIFQTVFDTIKLMEKEFINPEKVDWLLFNVAPYIVFTASFVGYAVIPFSSIFIGVNLNLGLFFFLAITSISVIGFVIAGWSSDNKYSLYGAMRSVSQIVSYEIPTAMSAIIIVILAGTLNMQDIVQAQSGGIFNWYIFGGPGGVSKIIIIPFMIVSCLILFTSTLAECNRAPFDIVEADSELVAGVHVEYSGMKFAMFFFAEYAEMFAVSALVTTLFFGGWQSPFGNLIPFLNNEWMQFFWSITKGLFFVFVQMWIRWTLPRLRVDQLMTVCWKYFIPIAFVNIFVIAIYVLL